MRPLTIALAAALAGATFQPPTPSAVYDIVVRHGTIVDGTGMPPYQADIAIAGDRIAAIGDLSHATARSDVDATGLYVAPGFINIHSHAVPNALPTAENMLTQGVTTEILNPDGGGPVDIDRQLTTLADGGLAVNVGAYVGFNSVWAQVVGAANRRASPNEIAKMQTLIVDGLSHGAWGVSAGLDYKPAYYATTDEVTKIVSVAEKWRTNFPNHDRLTPESGYSSRAGIGETIAIGEKTGLVPVVTHMKVQGREQGSAADVIRLMASATRAGHYVAADAYPYLAGQTALDALIVPAWAQDGGRAEMLKRFRDPELRPRIIKEAEEAMNARFNGAEGVYLPATRRQLVEIMREMNVSAGEAVLDIVEQQNTSAILRFGSEPDLVKVLQYPATAIACDCGASTSTYTHPRYYGTFPRVLGHYVRETHALTWQDAVRKMTALPASTVGIVDRGLLEPGMAADVTVFDPAAVIDHATYDDPARPSAGIREVIVNGHVALHDGKATGERGGRSLIRTDHMPSRPFELGGSHHVTFSGTINKVRLTIDLSQPASARHATGTLRIDDPLNALHEEMRDFGLLQVTDGWASITGILKTRGGDDQSATVIIDQKNPMGVEHGAAIVIDEEKGNHVSGTVAPASVKISR
ncbi:MAG TPA: amidohydrolase family protein [Vicinamibacterales bacterium]